MRAMMRDRRIELEGHGGPHAYIAWMSAAEALSWLTSGAWREAEARLRVALGSDPGPLGDIEARLAAARLAVLQGRQAEAESHLARVDELVVDGSAFLGGRVRRGACGGPARGRRPRGCLCGRR